MSVNIAEWLTIILYLCLPLSERFDQQICMLFVQVLVMTPQILLHNLSHCYIRIEFIALLIFDECHYAQVESDHPYAEIMKVINCSGVICWQTCFVLYIVA